MRLLPIVLVFALFLTGCPTSDISRHTDSSPTPDSPSTETPAEDTVGQADTREPIEPAVEKIIEQIQPKGRSGSVEHISTDGVKLEKFKTDDGKEGWSVQIPGGHPLATPAVVDGMVFVGGGFGSYEFYAFDARTGKPAWAIKVSDDGPTAAVAAEGCVVFNTESCTLFVVEAKTGKMIWSRWLGDPLMSQPAVSNGRIYMAYPGANGQHILICLDLKTGKEYWKKPIAGDIISAPVIGGGNVYLATFDGTVYCYKAADGKPLWRDKKNCTSAPYIVGDQVYVTLRKNTEKGKGKERKVIVGEGIAVFNGKSGKQLNKGLWNWRRAVYLRADVQRNSLYNKKNQKNDSGVGFGGGGPPGAKLNLAEGNMGQSTVSGLWAYQGSRPAVIDGVIYNGQGDVIQAIDAGTGKEIWRRDIKGDLKKIGGHLVSPPAVTGGKVLVGTVHGDVICCRKSDGKELWRCRIKNQQIRYQVSAVGGRVYVGTTGGKLICIDTGDDTLDGWTMWGGGPEHNGPSTK